MIFPFVITATAAALAAVVLFVVFLTANTAPQQAAGSVLAVALAAIPYIFARCVQIIVGAETERARHRELLAALKELGRATDNDVADRRA